MNVNARNRFFHVMAKPAGPSCNLSCVYCFYLEKKALFPENHKFLMSDEILEEYIRQYIVALDAPEVHFAWQGGEPTILGVDFFRKAVEIQKKYASGKKIINSIQTNGILIDDEWGEFLSENDFLVGLSIDGPRKFHDEFRVDDNGAASFHRVIKGLDYLKKHNVEFNTLTVVNKKNSRKPLEVYRFLKKIGSIYMQFIPLVERLPDEESKSLGLQLASPPSLQNEYYEEAQVAPWSVNPEQYGKFLISIFDEWVRRDVGRIFVQQFDNALASWYGVEPNLCYYRETCGDAMIIEHDGSVYSCDHFMYPEYKLGNIMTDNLKDMAFSEKQIKFGRDKKDALPKMCTQCPWLFACRGECPKRRFLKTPDGEPGLNYLCKACKIFFE